MRVHFLQHVPYEGLGTLQDWLQQRGHDVTATRLYAGDGLPRPDTLDLVIVMGGPMGIHDEADYPWLIAEKRFLDALIPQEIPLLGICLGAQLLADRLGARVCANREKEIGWFPVTRTGAAMQTALGECLPERFTPFHWHGDTFDLPAGAVQLARSEACENQAFLYRNRILGLQFHLEMTPSGARDLIDCNRQELVEAPYIQSADHILGQPRHFEASNRLMAALMDTFAAAAAETV